MSGAVRIVDPGAPRAYSSLGAGMRGLGGTEATVTRVARGLADGFAVRVEQRARTSSQIDGGVAWEPMDLRRPARPGETIVVLNSWKVALAVRARLPAARILLWLHVFPGRHNRRMGPALAAAGVEVVCVSASLARWLGRFLDRPHPDVRAVANPIDDTLRPNASPRDRDLLLFASAPHKGLDQVLDAFVALRSVVPSLRLEIADPGYLPWPVGALPPGAVALGSLDHGAVVERMRRALCLFYPQTRFAETFGLVIAEANAVGCPALVHGPLGANAEVAASPGQCIDGGDPAQIAERIAAWREVAPEVAMPASFRLSAVLQAWTGLLREAAAPTDDADRADLLHA